MEKHLGSRKHRAKIREAKKNEKGHDKHIEEHKARNLAKRKEKEMRK